MLHREKRFSLFDIELKRGVDISYPNIKKAGRTQIHQIDEHVTITSGKAIRTSTIKKASNDG